MTSSSDQKVVTGDRELVLTRTFNAPREKVFAAYSSCEHLRNWWGPRSWPMVECTMEFRVGGVWHYCLRGPGEDDASWGRAIFDEIVEPERIAYTDAFSDADGNVNPDMPQTRSSVELADAGGKTRLTLRATYPSAEDLRQVLDMGMADGITETLDRLDEHLAESVRSEA
jgi:uncharacterized protein YndB with AHSA1/START domain